MVAAEASIKVISRNVAHQAIPTLPRRRGISLRATPRPRSFTKNQPYGSNDGLLLGHLLGCASRIMCRPPPPRRPRDRRGGFLLCRRKALRTPYTRGVAGRGHPPKANRPSGGAAGSRSLIVEPAARVGGGGDTAGAPGGGFRVRTLDVHSPAHSLAFPGFSGSRRR
jgi:hypothetical protein